MAQEEIKGQRWHLFFSKTFKILNATIKQFDSCYLT